MSATTKVEIDSICEHYEAVRHAENLGPVAIRAFLQQFYPSLSAEPTLISELVQIDLQLSWMNWDKQLSAGIGTKALDVVQTEFDNLPLLDTYRDLFSANSPEFQETLREIAQCEMESRATWGDAIGPPFYAAKYGIDLQPVKRSRGNYVTVHSDASRADHSTPRFAIRGRSIIGRQRTGDTSDLFCEQRSDGNRIVVADRQEAFVSREQISILLLNPKFVLLKNIGSKSPVPVAGHGPVDPGNSTILPFDFIVRLPNCRLHFVHSAASETA